MTNYKVGQRVKIGGWSGTIVKSWRNLLQCAVDHGDGDTVLHLSWQELDLMGATIVLEPIEWRDGDVVEWHGLLRRESNGTWSQWAESTMRDDVINDAINDGYARRVAVTPLDS